MTENRIHIRLADISDAKELLAIYAPYVKETAITFEYTVPSIDEFTERIRNICTRYPYLAAICENEIVGYAYAGVFKERTAYDWAAEVSIYVKKGWHGKGIGRRLYTTLEGCLKQQNIVNLYACIASTETEDEYLTHDSIRFHERMSYKLIGEFRNCGYKFSRWYDMVWMEKMIGIHQTNQPEVIPFCKIKEDLWFDEKECLK